MRRIRDERGASAVEFAIIASLLLLILFGTITFGITFNRIQGLQSAAREGARIGSLSQTTVDQIKTRTLESVSILNSCNFMTNNACTSIRWCSGSTMNFDEGCLKITTEVRDASGTLVGAATEWMNDTDQPCKDPTGDASKTKSIVVQAQYRIKIEIPFWASPLITADGTGQFACETQTT